MKRIIYTLAVIYGLVMTITDIKKGEYLLILAIPILLYCLYEIWKIKRNESR